MINNQTLSLSVGVMNRSAPLVRALHTWIIHPEPDEILIVDWGSTPEVSHELLDLDPRIRILRVADRKHWANALCHNLELQEVKGRLLLRLDADCLLHRDFFSKHPPRENTFYCGNYKHCPIEHDDKRSLTGTLLISRNHVLNINGYNERLVHYGHEDDDLYTRLSARGLTQIDIDFSTVDHIPHSDQDRWKNLKIASELENRLQPIRDQIPLGKHKTARLERDYLIALSQSIDAKKPWTCADRMTLWTIQSQTSRYGTCEKATPDL